MKHSAVARAGDFMQLESDEVDSSADDTATTANTNSEYLEAKKNSVNSSHTDAHAASKILNEKVTSSSLLDHLTSPYTHSVAHQSDTETTITANPTYGSDNVHFTASQQASQNLEGLDISTSISKYYVDWMHNNKR